MSTDTTVPPLVRFAAVGDLLLAPAPAGCHYPRNLQLIAPAVRRKFQECDIVFGNLECTLPGDGGQVPTEPRVVATPELIRAVKPAGFHLVTIANNHTFDCLEKGFENLRSLLGSIGLPHFGAGHNLDEAIAPVVLDTCGLRIAFLGAVDERSGANQFAENRQAGVASLDVDRLVRQIQELRQHVDHVIVSLHWGEERFLIPSPVQVDQAHALADAGASMVLGHHPHVLQGLEVYRGVPIIYSLGNFVADEVHFTNGDAVRWDRVGQTGCILRADFTKDRVENIHQVPTYDSGHLVDLDDTQFGRQRIEATNQAIARGVTTSRYRREHFRVKTIKPAMGYLHWRRIKDLRPRHLWKAFRQVLHARAAE